MNIQEVVEREGSELDVIEQHRLFLRWLLVFYLRLKLTISNCILELEADLFNSFEQMVRAYDSILTVSEF